jgi:RNA polymerase sigma factor (sigma-70 family)
MQAPSDRGSELAGWLARTALGDRVAFAALYRATSAHLFGVVLRINRDRSQAEELLQDIYVNVWRAAGGFDAARAQPMTWLVSIARNRAIDSLRRAKADVKTVSRSLPGADGDGDVDLLAALPSDAAGPLQLLEQAADARALTRCVHQLSAEQQQCVALAYYQGLSHAEVAEHLVQPLGTVKSWVRRALAALKLCLARAANAGEASAQTPARGA